MCHDCWASKINGGGLAARECHKDLGSRWSTSYTTEFWSYSEWCRGFGIVPSTFVVSVCWQKPMVGMFKCNIDITFSSTQNWTGIGICVRDAEGVFVLAKTVSFPSVYSIVVGWSVEFIQCLAMVKWYAVWQHWFWDRLQTYARHVSL